MILIADDDRSIRWVLKKTLDAAGYDVIEATNGQEAWEALISHPDITLAFLDVRMPRMDGMTVLKKIRARDQNAGGQPPDVIIMTAQNTLESALLATREGAFDYLAKPFKVEEVEHLAERALSMRRLAQEVSHLRTAVTDRFSPGVTIIGSSPALQEVMKTAGRVARSDVTVLLEGESGTGKELIARTIHYNSARLERPFVAVNLNAIPRDLMESELLGYEKGAFTGAAQTTPGKIEHADTGTLFLDEIGDMPVELQGKLLRVLQEREFYRLGGKTPRRVDIRVIAATNKDLHGMMLRGEFREDLYYRLRVVPIYLPPLRERRDDIDPLIEFFLHKYRDELGAPDKELSTAARQLLLASPWPGNVRQLEHALMRALVLSRGPMLVPEDFPDLLEQKTRVDESMSLSEIIEVKIRPLIDTMHDVPEGNLYELLMAEMEKPLLRLALEKAEGNQLKAAKALGINRNTLRKKLSDYGIHPRG